MLLFSSCLQEHDFVITEEDRNQFVNDWIYSTMSYYYYWNSMIPNEKGDQTQPPKEYYKTLLYNTDIEKDRFSWITQGVNETINLNNGVSESNGFEYVISYSDTSCTELLGIVIYTEPKSEANNKGIVRGDSFYAIDGEKLTLDNYISLLSKRSANYSFIKNSTNDTCDIIINKEIVEQSPILHKSTLVYKNKRIGYLVYNGFFYDNGDNSKSYYYELLQTFSEFKSSDIQEFILDLRYNGGGQISIAIDLCSMLVPNIDTSNVCLKIRYNDNIMNSLYSDNNEPSFRFTSLPEYYIGDRINRLYILTTEATASCSELIINCLKPYMPITVIGTKTYGKNVGSRVFLNDKYDYAIQPIVMKLFNANNESDYSNGITPDIYVNEYYYPLQPLGDTEEPMLKVALYNIISHNKYAEIDTNNYVKIQIHNSLTQYCPKAILSSFEQ